MTRRYKELMVTVAHEDKSEDEFHGPFCEFAAQEQHRLMVNISEMASKVDTCKACALFSMISTLSANIFLILEPEGENSGKLSDAIKDLVDKAEQSAMIHMAEEEKVDKTEDKLAKIYAGRTS